MFLANRFSERPEKVIATNDISSLVENTSVRGEIEIEEESFYDLRAFILNLRDKSPKWNLESDDAEEQPNV